MKPRKTIRAGRHGARISTRRRATSGSRTHQHHKRGSWGVLVYLAGDTTKGAEAVEQDLAEILRAGSSPHVHIVIQHDGPHGANRYVVGARKSRNQRPTQSLGRLDSSAP